MTLSTHVYLLTEADPRDVFIECRRLLGATEEANPWIDDREGSPFRDDGVFIYRNVAGSGLPALLWVRYREGGPVRAEHEGHDEWCDEGCTFTHDPAHWVDVDFDTAYSYVGPEGGCGALHARLVFELGQWLDEREIKWAWRNEFSGEVHIGDRYERLADLIGDGQGAMRWLKGTVIPAIEGAGHRWVT